MSPMKRVNVTLDERTINSLDAITKATGASASEILRRGVELYWSQLLANIKDKVTAVEAANQQGKKRRKK